MNASINKWFYFFVIALFTCQLSMAQTYTNDNNKVDERERVANENITRSILSSFGVDNSANTRNFTIDGNSVFFEANRRV